jgi:hypothetical protein
MRHTSNINAFLSAAGSSDCLIQAYCGLVAIELLIKHEVGLQDHNICHGLDKFRMLRAIDNKSWTTNALLSLTNRLRNDIQAISANGKDGVGRSAPVDSYPYIRYSRIEVDGWAIPKTTSEQLKTLSDTVNSIRSFLKNNFALPL